MNIFDLMAKISLDTSEYNKGLDSSEKKANEFGTKLKKGLKTAAAAISVAAVAKGVVSLGKKLVQGTQKVAEYGDRIDKMSQKMRFSAKGFQEWDFIMQHNGSSIESVQKGMESLENAAKNGNDAFEKLGISQEQLASMNPEELWDATITGLQNVADESERARLAEKLFGRGARDLGPLLNMTAEETAAMRQQVNDLGGVMSDEAVKAAANYQDSLQNMQTAMSSIGRNILSEFLPGMTSVMDGITAIFSGDAEGGVGKITAGISDISTKIIEGIPKILDAGGKIIGGLLDSLLDADGLASFAEGGAEFILHLITGIIESIPKLVEKIPDIVSAIVKAFADAGPELIAAGSAVLDMIWSGIKSGWESMKEWFGDIVDKIKGFFNFNFELPKIKLPHFGITPAGWEIGDLLKGVIPKLGIEWYRKAYDSPYLFDKPTVVGNRGFGDGPGAEMVYGKNSLMRDIKQAVGTPSVTFNATINIAGDIQDPREKAQELMYEMKEIFDREAAAYGA